MQSGTSGLGNSVVDRSVEGGNPGGSPLPPGRKRLQKLVSRSSDIYDQTVRTIRPGKEKFNIEKANEKFINLKSDQQLELVCSLIRSLKKNKVYESEGPFRVSSNKLENEQVLCKLLIKKWTVDKSLEDSTNKVNVICTCIKHLFKLLNFGSIKIDEKNTFANLLLNVGKIQSHSEKLILIKNSLPKLNNKQIFAEVMSFLFVLSKYDEITKMGIQNLAMPFSPLISLPSNEGDLSDMFALANESKQIQEVLAFIIGNAEEIFSETPSNSIRLGQGDIEHLSGSTSTEESSDDSVGSDDEKHANPFGDTYFDKDEEEAAVAKLIGKDRSEPTKKKKRNRSGAKKRKRKNQKKTVSENVVKLKPNPKDAIKEQKRARELKAKEAEEKRIELEAKQEEKEAEAKLRAEEKKIELEAKQKEQEANEKRKVEEKQKAEEAKRELKAKEAEEKRIELEAKQKEKEAKEAEKNQRAQEKEAEGAAKANATLTILEELEDKKLIKEKAGSKPTSIDQGNRGVTQAPANSNQKNAERGAPGLFSLKRRPTGINGPEKPLSENSPSQPTQDSFIGKSKPNPATQPGKTETPTSLQDETPLENIPEKKGNVSDLVKGFGSKVTGYQKKPKPVLDSEQRKVVPCLKPSTALNNASAIQPVKKKVTFDTDALPKKVTSRTPDVNYKEAIAKTALASVIAFAGGLFISEKLKLAQCIKEAPERFLGIFPHGNIEECVSVKHKHPYILSSAMLAECFCLYKTATSVISYFKEKEEHANRNILKLVIWSVLTGISTSVATKYS